VRDLNRLYRTERALHACDADDSGFRWVIGDDRANSVYAFWRFGNEDDTPILVVCNLTPAPRQHYRIGVPRQGVWREIINTDSAFYAGSNVGNEGAVHASNTPAHGEPQSIELTIPPLATIMLRRED